MAVAGRGALVPLVTARSARSHAAWPAPHGRGGRAGAVQRARPAAQGVHLHLGHALQLGDAGELEVEAVHDHPGQAVEDVEDEPDEEHEDVVGGGAAHHVIDDGGVDPGHDLPGREDAHGPQPSLEATLFLQPESVVLQLGAYHNLWF